MLRWKAKASSNNIGEDNCLELDAYIEENGYENEVEEDESVNNQREVDVKFVMEYLENQCGALSILQQLGDENLSKFNIGEEEQGTLRSSQQDPGDHPQGERLSCPWPRPLRRAGRAY